MTRENTDPGSANGARETSRNGKGVHYGSFESEAGTSGGGGFPNEERDLERGVSAKSAKDSVRSTRTRGGRPMLTRALGVRHMDADRAHRVDWSEYRPTSGGPISWIRWLVLGYSEKSRHSDEEALERFSSLARMLTLLREYEERFGTPQGGGPGDRQLVLKDLTTRLYSSGAPIWVLESVMAHVAEGLMGKKDVDFFLLPRKAFIFSSQPSTTVMFRTDRGFNMHRMDLIEKVSVRLASFASNTQSVSSIASHLPRPEDMHRLAQHQSQFSSSPAQFLDREELAEEILNLASEGAGLFFFTNFIGDSQSEADSDHGADKLRDKPADAFWNVKDAERELFSRLAALEATKSIAEADEKGGCFLYPTWAVLLFRVGSSAGACAIWYNGSWVDMLVAGALAVLVGYLDKSSVTRHERIISEVISSLIVGISTGLIALRWPDHSCFGAMALGAVLDILQGFRVVYSIIELMSRHTVSGGADLLEGVIFTALISYFLKFGQYIASEIMGNPSDAVFLTCSNGISQWWYFLFVPVAAVSWSGLFAPYHVDLFLMGLHGVISYAVYWAMYKAVQNDPLCNFVAALAVTASAGIVSRFTGRQALGNTVAGIYVLLPGAYLVKSMFSGATGGFVEVMILNAVVIGLGAWTGTLLCSPTLLGTNRGLLMHHQSSKHGHPRHGALLFF